MKLTVITQPTVEPITLSDAKNFLHIEESQIYDDVYITSLITTARSYCEEYQKRAYLSQKLQVVYDARAFISPWSLELPRSTVLQSVTAVKTKTGATITDIADYTIGDDLVAKVNVETSGLSADTVIVEYLVGVATAADVPAQVKQAMRMLIAHWYENRSAVTMETVTPKELPLAVKSLLNQGRVM